MSCSRLCQASVSSLVGLFSCFCVDDHQRCQFVTAIELNDDVLS